MNKKHIWPLLSALTSLLALTGLVYMIFNPGYSVWDYIKAVLGFGVFGYIAFRLFKNASNH